MPRVSMPGSDRADRLAAAAEGWPAFVAKAEEDVLAYMRFPEEQWTRVYSTNPLEKLNKEVKRRTNVVGVFPDEASVLRLVGSVLIEV